MSGRDVVIEFTRGVMDRIRDYCKEVDPEKWAGFDEIPPDPRGVFLAEERKQYWARRRREDRYESKKQEKP